MPTTFRTLLTCLAFAIPLLVCGASKPVSDQKYILYVGAYGKGISGYRFDPNGSKLEPLGLLGEVVNPSFITADKGNHHLYAVSEVEGNTHGAVVSFSIDRKTGQLARLNARDSGGVAPCHLALDRTGRMLIVANYTSGGVSVYPIERDGSLGEMSTLQTAHGHGPNAERQEGPHAHEVVIGSENKIAYVPDLGLDEIRLFRIEPSTGMLVPNQPPFVKQDPGMGPRHIVFSQDEQFAYVINELKSEVSVFHHDKTNGSMTKIQDVSSLPAGYKGENGPAEILIDAKGTYIYATNRGNDSIAVFAVDAPTGTLRQVQVVSAEGKMPRGLEFDPTGRYLFAGNQNSNNFVIFEINAATGQLSPTGQVVNTPAPVAFLFVPAH
jgi:6-phosphogluconolactonase